MKKKIHHHGMKTTAMSILCAATLAACGGGGGSDSASPDLQLPGDLVAPAALTLADAQLIAGRVASVAGVMSFLDTFSEISYDNFEPSGPASETDTCEMGGSYTRLQTDADGNLALSAGDTLASISNGCIEDLEEDGTVQSDGRYDITVLAISGTPYFGFGSWSTRNRQTYTGFTLGTSERSVRLDGTAEIQNSATLNTYRFSDLSQSSPRTLNFIQILSGEAAIEATGTSSSTQNLNLSFTNMSLVTNLSATDKVRVAASSPAALPLRFGSNGVVSSGSLILQLEKAKVVLTVVAPNQVRIDVDNNNDGSIDATQSMSWAAVIAAATL
jgi:hypothetical protein